jgi:hypothetical protein
MFNVIFLLMFEQRLNHVQFKLQGRWVIFELLTVYQGVNSTQKNMPSP